MNNSWTCPLGHKQAWTAKEIRKVQTACIGEPKLKICGTCGVYFDLRCRKDIAGSKIKDVIDR